MKSKRKFLPRLKAFFSAILIMACAGGMTSFCLANVPIKLEIKGTECFNGELFFPSGGYTAELTGVQPTGEYEWSISSSTPFADFVNPPQGKYATIIFTSAPSSSEGRLTVKLSCKAYYMVENKRKFETDDMYVTWTCPRVTVGINGNTEVLEGLEETYTGSVSIENNPDPTVTYTWRVGDSEGDGVEADSFTTTFDKGGQTVTLYCDIKAGDIPLKAEKEIHVHSYAMSVERWDYSGPLEGPEGKRKINHNHSTSSADEIVYIHYNIDDDDEDGRCDFDQEEFINNESDDDLCKLKIDINVEGEFTVDDLDKQITITTSEGLRLWRSQYRKGKDFMQGKKGKKDKKVEKTWTVSDITRYPIYIEGLKHNSLEMLTISFGKIKKMLQYKTCSVGDEKNQPNLEQRRGFKKAFPNLIDCEWCIFRPSNPTYNCIAFSVDPYLTTFKKVDYKGRRQIRNHMEIDPKYPYPFWVYSIGFNVITCPTDQNDTTDKFRLEGISYCDLGFLAELKQLSETDDFNMVFISERYVFFGNVYISGYTERFKSEIINRFSGVYAFKNLKYYLTMRDFNPYYPMWTLDSDINAFFCSPVWANSRGKNLEACDDDKDDDRVVIYYDGFHAARRASTLKGKEKIDENEMPPGWVVFASKCGKGVAIFHMEDQMEGGDYGNIYKAYKY